MRLLTFISLKAPGKDVKTGYPMDLRVDEMDVVETRCDEDFMRHIIPTLEWAALQKCAQAVGVEGLPGAYSAALLEDTEFLGFVHNLLLDIHVMKGTLICPETGRQYPIVDGIANMMYVFTVGGMCPSTCRCVTTFCVPLRFFLRPRLPEDEV
jgi:multifunctional methyltransferase subunit TRM112